MGKRPIIVLGMAVAMIWAVAIIWLPQRLDFPFMPINVALILAFTPPGLAMLVLIARAAARRFFDDGLIDGQDYPPGSGGWTDQKVLTNTTEQIALALAVWPFVALTLGGQVVIVMGVGFAFARLAFWLGYHLSPPLRAFGFGATFYPTVFASLWSLFVWAF